MKYLLALLLSAGMALGAVPAFTDFNLNWFTTNAYKVGLQSGVTNKFAATNQLTGATNDLYNTLTNQIAASTNDANTVASARYGWISGTNVWTGTNTFPQVRFTTNLATAAPDFRRGYTLFQTNAAFAVLAPIGLDATKTLAETTVFIVTNSTAAVVTITAPANVIQQGTWNVTNLTAITFFQYGQKFTNGTSLPLF